MNADMRGTVKLEGDIVLIARRYKKETGIPVWKFIGDAVRKEIDTFPSELKGKLGVGSKKKK